jgi:Flp pilus assembly protein TadG
MTPLRSLRAVLGAYWRDQSGATAILMVLFTIFALISITGMVVDIGDAFVVQRQLQAATDAAAIAGAFEIPSAAASSTATAYGSISGSKNLVRNSSATVTMVSGFPKLKYVSSTGVHGQTTSECPTSTFPNGCNAIQVKQQAAVPTYFLRFIGINSLTVNATATAGLKGGPGKALDIVIILDTTQSMNDGDNSCSITGASRLTCAEAGARTLLTGLSTSLDYVSLMVFPGVSTATAANDYDCSGSTKPTVVPYSSALTTNYQILTLGNDFLTGGALNTSSNFVRAVGGGGTSCSAGLTAVGGEGTFYADVIGDAQSYLTANGRSNAQKVIILLSDGDADASTAPSAEASNQCSEAVSKAQTATAAGTWVYAVAYGASTGNYQGKTPTGGSGTASCASDTGTHAISACTAMSEIASDSSKFFSDGQGASGACQSSNASSNISELVSLFSSLAQSLGNPRLIPDDTA